MKNYIAFISVFLDLQFKGVFSPWLCETATECKNAEIKYTSKNDNLKPASENIQKMFPSSTA